jgi:murein DD-endopeptidase MepM/ murein hydrolase activator NlpD
LDSLAEIADENARKLGDCSLYGPEASSLYVLPFAVGTERLVWRATEHFARGNGGVGLYAIDFETPVGTPVVAARAGEVVALRDQYSDGNGRDLEENFVFVRHDDGSIARYLHLTHRGALVKLGTRIGQGQIVARSGNTGQSAGPHLHFDVQRCGPNLPPDYNRLPCGQTLPLTFRNTEPHPCGLVAGRRYTAR